MATSTTKAKTAMDPDIRSTEALENFVQVHAQFLLDESDLLSNVAVTLEPRLIARLKQAGLDEARVWGMGSTAAAAAKSVTRHFKVAAELEETATRALRRAWLNYLRNIVEPILAAESAQKDFTV